MQRRTFLTGIGAVACAKGGPQPPVRPRSTSHLPPRKVIVGTVMQSFWEAHPGLEKRLDQLAAIVDRMSEESKRKYGRDLEIGRASCRERVEIERGGVSVRRKRCYECRSNM